MMTAHRIRVLLFVFNLIVTSSYAQSNLFGEYKHHLTHAYELDSIENTRSKLEDLNSIDYNGLAPNLKWAYNMAKASYMSHLSHFEDNNHHYIDSINLYLSRSIATEPKEDQTSLILYLGYTGFKRAVARGRFLSKKYHYFLEDIPNMNVDTFLFIWNIKRPIPMDDSQEKPDLILSDSTIADRWADIYLADQTIRKNLPLDNNSMRIIDSVNRIRIDSIYELDKDLGRLSEGERAIASLVLHHSTDWTWNKKWIDRLLCGRMNGLSHGPILSLALERHLFHTKSTFKHEPDFIEFLDYLIETYPKEAEEYNLLYYRRK